MQQVILHSETCFFLLDGRSENSLKNIFFFLCLKVQILLLEEGSDSHRGPQTLNKAVIQ